MTQQAFPTFFLYGEPPRAVEDRFLHLEDLGHRSRPAEWNIRPHAHSNLNHVFHIDSGRGDMRVDGRTISFSAPSLLVVPAGAVHGFAFEADARGSVLTISEVYLQEMQRREREFDDLFHEPAVIALPSSQPSAELLQRLSRELAWRAPGHTTAVEAALATLMVEILRHRQAPGQSSARPHGAKAGLVARFREVVEARFRSEARVEIYAAALSVSPKQLRLACISVAGVSPLRIIHDRQLLEAKRLMLYSNMTMAEISYSLGFTDPAYFSRFFSRTVGVAPRAFRQGASVNSRLN